MPKSIKIKSQIIDTAKNIAVNIENEEKRKSAYALAIGALSLADYLTDNGFDIDHKASLFKIPQVAEILEISDLYLDTLKIDVRVIFEDGSFYVPKSHETFETLPDIYAVVKIENNFEKFLPVGFIKTDNLDKSETIGDYYKYSTDILLPFSDFLEEAKTIPLDLKAFMPKVHEKILELTLAFFDKQIDEEDKLHFIQHITACPECREKISEVNEFATVVSQVKNFPELLKDYTLNVLSGTMDEISDIAKDAESAGLSVIAPVTPLISEAVVADIPDISLDLAGEEVKSANEPEDDLDFLMSLAEEEIDNEHKEEESSDEETAQQSDEELHIAENSPAEDEFIIDQESSDEEITADIAEEPTTVETEASDDSLDFTEAEHELLIEDTENIETLITDEENKSEELSVNDNAEVIPETPETNDNENQFDELTLDDLELVDTSDDLLEIQEEAPDFSEEPIVEHLEVEDITQEAVEPESSEDIDNLATPDDLEDLLAVEPDVLEALDVGGEILDSIKEVKADENSNTIETENVSFDEVMNAEESGNYIESSEDEPVDQTLMNDDFIPEFDKNPDEILDAEFPDENIETDSSFNVQDAFIAEEEESVQNTDAELSSEEPEAVPKVDDEIQGLLDDDLLKLLAEDEPAPTEDIKPQEDETPMHFDMSEHADEHEDFTVTEVSEDAEVSEHNIEGDEVQNDETIGALYEAEEPSNPEEIPVINVEEAPAMVSAMKSTKKFITVSLIFMLLLVSAGGTLFYKHSKQTAQDQDETQSQNDIMDFGKNANGAGDNQTPIAAQDINKSMTNSFSDTPSPITITKISWNVSERLAADDAFKKYLQVAGKNLQLNLQNDLAYITEVAYENKIQAAFTVTKANEIKNVKVTGSSGSEQIDNVVLRSIKETLKYVKAPAVKDYNGDYNLSVVINF